MVNRTQWLRDAGWGVFVHYLVPSPSTRHGAETTADDWSRQVDSVDVDHLAGQLAKARARYCILTIGQNSGHFCSPNATYDKIVGRKESKCSRRDLVADLSAAMKRYGTRLLVYLPSHAPALDREAVEKLRCTPEWDASQWCLMPGTYVRSGEVDKRLSEFQRNWESVIREWSGRWGDNVHGWWFDGCYYADLMYRGTDEPGFKTFVQAARSGNDNSIVAFNTGIHLPVRRETEYEDYTAGEISGVLPYATERWASKETMVVDGYVNGAQYHILSYLGEYWGQGQPRFSQAFLNEYTRHINRLKGAISWDVPIDAHGVIPECFIDQLKELSEVVGP